MDKYRHALGLVAENSLFAGSAEKEFDNRSATSANKIKLMQSRWDSVQLKLGNKLIPTIERLFDALEPVIDALGQFIEKNPKLTTGIVLIVGGLGAMAIAIAPVLTAIASLTLAMAYMGKTAAVSAGQTRMGAAANAMNGFYGGKGKGKSRLLNMAKGKAGVIGGLIFCSIYWLYTA